jgi:N-carbamoylputrescine amidase
MITDIESVPDEVLTDDFTMIDPSLVDNLEEPMLMMRASGDPEETYAVVIRYSQSHQVVRYFTPGDTGYQVFDTKAGKLGVGICWDQWFLETGRILALKGADYLLFPTAIGSEPTLDKDSMPHWRNAMVGQSALNIMPVVASNRIGTEKEKNSSMTFYGSSFITDETGTIVESANRTDETILTHTFDLDALYRNRRDWGIFRDRRPEMYHDILKNDASKRSK